jgi:glycosyltransferase involved in cell wall biosynthesis
MNILFHHTAVPADLPRLDAVMQEIDFLQRHFRGQTVWLRPRLRAFLPFPRYFFGFQTLRWLRSQEGEVDFHHVFNPDLYLFPVLTWLKRPIIYSPVAGLSKSGRTPAPSLKRRLAWIVVNNRRDWESLQELGFSRVRLIPPGFDRSAFTPSPPPSDKRLILLVGSAPWNLSQFNTKGVDTLLAAVGQIPDLKLIFLWRGIHGREMEKKVIRAGVGDRVELIQGAVDVNRVLAGVHAGIVLADRPTLVKAHPNSLMEALAAGRPILISRCIAMADLAEETGCGVVLDDNSLAEVVRGIQILRAGYGEYQQKALAVGRERFSPAISLEGYRDLYAAVQRTGL